MNPAIGVSGDGAVNVWTRGEWLRPLLAITGVILTRSRRLGASIAYVQISNRPGCAEAWPVLLCSGRPWEVISPSPMQSVIYAWLS